MSNGSSINLAPRGAGAATPTDTTASAIAQAGAAGAAAGTRTNAKATRRGYAAMFTAAASNQTGAALGAHAFDAIGPAGVVAVRQIVAAVALVPTARPRWRSMTWAQWWPALALAAVFVGMNLGLYTAISRVGLGLAVTLEFLGPLAVALLGSRRRIDLAAAVLASIGVYVLVLPGPSTDLVGIACGLFAALCWAGYILLNKVVGARLPGAQGPAVASTISSLACLPILVAIIADGRMTTTALLFAVAAGLFSSTVPYALDLFALRHVTPAAFGLFMSVHPVLAAFAGLVLLGQWLAVHEWIGILIVVTANAVALGVGARSANLRPADLPGCLTADEPTGRGDETMTRMEEGR
ncbi:inner membrane transporter RhtA [Kineosphaera limosa]|nr:EamA family transporter [Kineosphaera limosa]NYD98915.1 inner membrane transporter RhtA [Kineosphaera limosa]